MNVAIRPRIDVGIVFSFNSFCLKMHHDSFGAHTNACLEPASTFRKARIIILKSGKKTR